MATSSTAAPPASAEPSRRGGEGSDGPRAAGGDLVRLWLGVLLPPIGWIIDLLGQYALTRWAYLHARVWPLWVAGAVGLSACGWGAVFAWGARKRQTGSGDDRANHRAMAGWGMALAVYFFALILAQSVPLLVLDIRELT